MKRILSLLLALILTLNLVPSALTATPEAENAANTLYRYGLFKGTGTDQNGRPIFDLDRTLNRHEAVTLLVRILGKESEAQQTPLTSPFTDVDTWAKPYVGYAYAHGLVNGTSSTTFNGKGSVSASQYITMMLRALGYSSGTDFQWDRAWELSDKIGLTDGRYNANTKVFTRGDAAIISNNALDVYVVNSGKKLGETLGISESTTGPSTPPTTKSGLDTLISYVVNNGSLMGNGEYYLSFPFPTDSLEGLEKIDLGILYDANSSTDGLFPDGKLFFSSDMYFSSGVTCNVFLIYDIATKEAFGDIIKVSITLSDTDVDICSASSFSFDIASYTKTTTLSFDKAYFESNFSTITYEDYVGLFSPSVQMAMAAWEGFLEVMVGITLRDIGFTSYPL